MKQNILVLFGGKSAERKVSMKTGQQVMINLNRDKYNVIPQEVDRDDFWIKKVLDRKDEIDVVFLALHGGQEENGTIQGLLDYLGFQYTGSGVLASALGMNKFAQFGIFKEHGLLIPWTIYLDINQNLEKIKTQLDFPLVLKPNDQGSSVGVMMIENESDFTNKVNNLTIGWSQHRKVLIQRKIEGRELTCGVISDSSYQQVDVFPITEIKPKAGDFFDYRSKYEVGGSEEITPAEIDSQLARKIQEQSLQAHKLLGCSGLTRTDFILEKGTNKLFVLEINTLPGMTETSLCPQGAKAYGWNFSKLLDEIIDRS